MTVNLTKFSSNQLSTGSVPITPEQSMEITQSVPARIDVTPPGEQSPLYISEIVFFVVFGTYCLACLISILMKKHIFPAWYFIRVL